MAKPLAELLAERHSFDRTDEIMSRLLKLDEAVSQCETEKSLPKPAWLRRILDGEEDK